jgi:hypothetical protein
MMVDPGILATIHHHGLARVPSDNSKKRGGAGRGGAGRGGDRVWGGCGSGASGTGASVGAMVRKPWEPPLAGSDETQLIGALERLRTVFRWKADELDATGFGQRIGKSSLTLGALLKHLALVEEFYFGVEYDGTPLGEPWSGVDFDADPEWEFRTAADDPPAALYALWDDAVERSRLRLTAALARPGGLDQPAALQQHGVHASLRRLLTDLVEEYGRHTGHADLLREAVDGRTGEDPPDGWRPQSGRYRLPGADRSDG